MTTATLDDLLNGLVDDLLDDADLQRLQELLVSDQAARCRYRRFLTLHSGLRWDYASAARTVSTSQPGLASRRRPLAMVLLAIAATVVAGVALAWWSSAAVPVKALLTTTDIAIASGSLTWSDGARERRVEAVGDQLPAGRLTLEGDSASATLRFADGSTVTLSGECELTISDQGQKLLHVLRGVMTADIVPQQPGRPMLVHTGTAALEVVGTRFTISTTGAQTLLSVEHGSVRMQRLADGQAVLVSKHQEALASLDIAHPLASRVRMEQPTAWSLDCSRAPPSHWRATWSPPQGDQPGFLRAVPYIAGRSQQGTPLIHYGITIPAPEGENIPFVHFTAASRVRLRLRVTHIADHGHVEVMICTHTTSGAFGGTFMATVPLDQHAADADGWRTVALQMADFLPARASQPSMVDREAVFILPRSTSAQTGLEVSELQVNVP
jgi:ferric-dicitrate binding protein FerR (iron transport regulator)